MLEGPILKTRYYTMLTCILHVDFRHSISEQYNRFHNVSDYNAADKCTRYWAGEHHMIKLQTSNNQYGVTIIIYYMKYSDITVYRCDFKS